MRYLRALCHSAISLLALAGWGLLYLAGLPFALRPERRLARRLARPASRGALHSRSEYWRRRCQFFETQCYQLARMHREYRERHGSIEDGDWWKRGEAGPRPFEDQSEN